MKYLSLMNTYLSNLALLQFKLHHLHWNVSGMHFMPIHQFTESLYTEVFEAFDAVAEHIKIKGEKPFVTLKEYQSNATINELEYQGFSGKEVLEILNDDLKHMKDLGLQIRSLADEHQDFTAVALLEGYIEGFEKNLWFIKQMLG